MHLWQQLRPWVCELSDRPLSAFLQMSPLFLTTLIKPHQVAWESWVDFDEESDSVTPGHNHLQLHGWARCPLENKSSLTLQVPCRKTLNFSPIIKWRSTQPTAAQCVALYAQSLPSSLLQGCLLVALAHLSHSCSLNRFFWTACSRQIYSYHSLSIS